MMVFAVGYSLLDLPNRQIFIEEPAEVFVEVDDIEASPRVERLKETLRATVQLQEARLIVPPHRRSNTRLFLPLTVADWKAGDPVSAVVAVDDIISETDWMGLSSFEEQIVNKIGITPKFGLSLSDRTWQQGFRKTLEIETRARDITSLVLRRDDPVVRLLNEAGMAVDDGLIVLRLDDFIPWREPLWWTLSRIFTEVALVFFLIGLPVFVMAVLMRLRLAPYLRDAEAPSDSH